MSVAIEGVRVMTDLFVVDMCCDVAVGLNLGVAWLAISFW